jgi:hypothetical protein
MRPAAQPRWKRGGVSAVLDILLCAMLRAILGLLYVVVVTKLLKYTQTAEEYLYKLTRHVLHPACMRG